MMSSFKKIIIIGYGKATGRIIEYVDDRRLEFGYELEFIEHEIHPFSITLKICKERNIPSRQIEDKALLKEYFIDEAKLVEVSSLSDEAPMSSETFSGDKSRKTGKLLILSASNNFLFPKELVDRENVTIINFHNALLPKFPGRNAPSWVIFEGEKETGITWHYVTSGVDEGNIIIQKKCDITSDVRAFELTEHLMDLAYEGFCECFEDVLLERAEAIPQPVGDIQKRIMYKSKEVPGNATFSLEEKTEGIYRLLRSLDYGKNDIFPNVTTMIDGVRVEIVRYRKVSPQKVEDAAVIALNGKKDVDDKFGRVILLETDKGFLYLPFEDGDYLKLKYKEKEL